MGQAFYDIVAKGNEWTVVHDGAASGDYITKEAAFEVAAAAASNAIKSGHEVRITVPGRDAGKQTALGSKSRSKKK